MIHLLLYLIVWRRFSLFDSIINNKPKQSIIDVTTDQGGYHESNGFIAHFEDSEGNRVALHSIK